MTYPKVTTAADNAVPQSPSFPAIETAVLAYWEKDATFQASIDNRPAGEDGSNEFVFYDGPPFANGLPHYGHLLTGYVKDLIPRYQTMRGKRVERRFGWDTHGLPAELEAMRLAGIKTTDEIVEMGIDKFNDLCRESVLKYTGEWRSYVTRQARWVDFDNDYRTLNPDYMESVIWAFKSLYDKGLIYEGFRILPYCWNDETPLSNHELRMDDDVYQDRQDPAVTLGFRCESDDELDGALFLIWTTTPWTLPSNMGIAVGPDIEYVVVESDTTGTTERYVLAKERLASYAKELGDDPVVVATLTGAQLAGHRYTPPFTYYVDADPNAHQVLVADFVTTADGTGLVHMAPGFGEDDKATLDAAGVETVVPVGKDGRFTFPVVDYQGQQVFEANRPVIDDLKAATRGEAAGSVSPGTVLLRQETYNHSYPHCWRCRKPLIYMAVSSWFVEVTKFKQRMLDLNEEISWTPEHIQHGQFGKWLENARDWSITRNRFWGSPVPVWKSDDPAYPRVDVYGSFEEIERDFGTPPLNRSGERDLHRPWVDNLTRPNPDDPRPEGEGRSAMRRVTDVLDVWFDSGSMSFAQNHVPFENADWFSHHFPADFIVEYIGQTRGWFYTLHILATALFDKPAFASCVSHGIVLGSDGNKMSKSLRNYPDVSEVFDRDGADAMRWFLMASPILRGGNLVVTEPGIRDSVRQVMIPLWNSWYFFQLYANAANDRQGYDAKPVASSSDPLDRYILAKARQYVGDMTSFLDEYAVAEACETTRGFLDVVTNWYIRRSRDRFWDGESAAGQAAFDTLYTVLDIVCRTTAPLLPLLTEEIWRGLTGGRSVHLSDWPSVDELPDDPELVAAMDQVRDVCSTTSSLRKARGLRNRLPLSQLTIVGGDVAGFEDILHEVIRDEVNVKSVRVVAADAPEATSYGVSQQLTVNARAAGPRLGKDVQVAIRGSKSGDWRIDPDGAVVAGGLALVEGEYTLETVAGGDSDAVAVAMLASGGFVALDTEVTPELAAEGLARDLIRGVQQLRRDAGLDISDRIALSVGGTEEILAAIRTHADLIQAETLAVTLDSSAELAGGAEVFLADGSVHVAVAKAS